MVVSCAAFGCENRWIPKKELLPGQKNISFHFLLFLCIYLMWRVMLRRSGKLAIRNGWMASNNCPGVLHWASRCLLYQYQGPLHKVFLDCLKKGAFCSMLRHFFSSDIDHSGKRRKTYFSVTHDEQMLFLVALKNTVGDHNLWWYWKLLKANVVRCDGDAKAIPQLVSTCPFPTRSSVIW